MLGYVIAILLALWSVGLLTGNYFDGFIHLLLVAVLVTFILRYLSGKKLKD